MTDTIIAISLLWIFVIIYAVAASFDFGAGFWSMVYLNREKNRATTIANRYLSPSWFLSLALIPTLLGHSIFNWIIKWLSTTTISMSILGEAVGAALLAYLLLGEGISTAQWIGGVVILAGIYLFIRTHSHPKGATDHDPTTETPKKPA